MIHSEGIKQRAQTENTQKLWDVLDAYKNDPEGLTRHQLTELAGFNLAEGRSADDIFSRAMKVCKRRAIKAGMIIPHATRSKSGYVYLLTDRANLVVDGFLTSERVMQGMQRATHTHQKFIEQDLASLPAVERVAFEQIARISDQRQEDRERNLQDRLEVLQLIRVAASEERESRGSV